MGQREDMAAMWAEIRALKASLAQRPISANRGGPPGSIEITVRATHSFTEGLAIVNATTWSLLDSEPEYPHLPPQFPRMWGIVSAAGSGWFRVVIQGSARVSGVTAGSRYSFVAGVATEQTGFTSDPSFQTSAPSAVSHADGYIHVCNDSMPVLKTGVGATFSLVYDSTIGIGNYVVYAGVPGISSPLALADTATPWSFANVGIALFEFGAADQWLVLTNGEASYTIEGGDFRPAWLTSSPWLETGGGDYARMYLSESAGGQYATSEPTFKVYAGRISATYTAASPPSPAYTTFTATAIGTSMSMHWDSVTEKPAAFPPSGSITLNTDTTDTANSNALTFSGSIGAQTWTMYEKRPRYNAKWLQDFPISTTDPTQYQFLRFNGTDYIPYGPLLSAANQLLSHDGTDLAIIAAPGSADTLLGRRGTALTWAKVARAEMVDGTACTVIGRSANSTGALADIAASADSQILARISGALAFTNAANLAWRMGNVTLYTSNDTHVVPSGKRFLTAVIIGAGGGGYGTSSATSLGYIASSSGGSPTTQIYRSSESYGGGSGGMTIVVFDAAALSGASITVVVGSAGSAGSAGGNNGGNGGESYIDVVSRFSAGGGVGGGPISNSAGGNAMGIIAYNTGDYNLFMLSFPGQNGGYGGRVIAASSTIDPDDAAHGGRSVYATTYGRGGNGGLGNNAAGSAGQAGAVLFFTD